MACQCGCRFGRTLQKDHYCVTNGSISDPAEWRECQACNSIWAKKYLEEGVGQDGSVFEKPNDLQAKFDAIITSKPSWCYWADNAPDINTPVEIIRCGETGTYIIIPKFQSPCWNPNGVYWRVPEAHSLLEWENNFRNEAVGSGGDKPQDVVSSQSPKRG